MKYAIVGSRSVTNYTKIVEILNSYAITSIVSGGANGVDKLAEQYAAENQLPITLFIPDWKLHGRGAGIIRNKQIVSDADRVIAFWDNKSKGTLNSINTAKKLGKPVDVWIVENDEFSKFSE